MTIDYAVHFGLFQVEKGWTLSLWQNFSVADFDSVNMVCSMTEIEFFQVKTM